jgi:hypothetical protein
MMYRGTPLPTRYEVRRPEPSTAAELLTSLLGSGLFAVAVAGLLAAFYLAGS